MKFKDINIGEALQIRVAELDIQLERICNFLNITSREVEEIYKSKSIDCELLLKWSKLLEYDFFRLYSQHLIFYAPPSATASKEIKTALPVFRKNIYTKELIDFIVELVENNIKTKNQIIEEYNIPKTTLYKWLNKNKK